MKKTILITGSTDGIGKLAAIKLAEAGHKIYLHGRNEEKLNACIQEIKTQSQNDDIHGFTADFSDIDAVKKMATQVSSDVPKIDILINNAGVFNSPMPDNKDGLDMRFVVNYLAPYVLTHALMPLLEKGTSPQIINLSSAAQATVQLDILTGKRKASERETYAQSKLALTMWSFDLAKKRKDLAVIAVNPGSLLNTNMVREAFGHHWAPADKGAQILYNLAVADTYEGITGMYFDNDKGAFGEAHADAYDDAAIEALIRTTEGMLEG